MRLVGVESHEKSGQRKCMHSTGVGTLECLNANTTYKLKKVADRSKDDRVGAE
mgnify:CR=1 FL=1